MNLITGMMEPRTSYAWLSTGLVSVKIFVATASCGTANEKEHGPREVVGMSETWQE